jgi:probable rRNA maturation factor
MRRPASAFQPSVLLPSSQRPVTFHNAYPHLRLDRRAIARAIHLLDAHLAAFSLQPSVLQSFGHELSLAFLTDTALATLHAEFLDDPAPTDVITFAGAPALGLAGEICISVDAARRQKGASRPTGDKFSAELTLYLVHGWLHLAGHDDLAPGPRRRMRAAEARAMNMLRATGTVPRFRVLPRTHRTTRQRHQQPSR